jgi:uncharacterized glyoxalase superfamily protein PhnB
MKPTPPGWPRLSVAVFYDEAAKAIDWLSRAFGFEVQLKVEGDDGHIQHSELRFGEAMVMVADAALGRRAWGKSPRSLNGFSTQSVFIYVDDVDAHCQRARGEGAEIVTEPKTTDYGDDFWSDRSYEAVDPEGHHWWFSQRLRNARAK